MIRAEVRSRAGNHQISKSGRTRKASTRSTASSACVSPHSTGKWPSSINSGVLDKLPEVGDMAVPPVDGVKSSLRRAQTSQMPQSPQPPKPPQPPQRPQTPQTQRHFVGGRRPSVIVRHVVRGSSVGRPLSSDGIPAMSSVLGHRQSPVLGRPRSSFIGRRLS